MTQLFYVVAPSPRSPASRRHVKPVITGFDPYNLIG